MNARRILRVVFAELALASNQLQLQRTKWWTLDHVLRRRQIVVLYPPRVRS